MLTNIYDSSFDQKRILNKVFVLRRCQNVYLVFQSLHFDYVDKVYAMQLCSVHCALIQFHTHSKSWTQYKEYESGHNKYAQIVEHFIGSKESVAVHARQPNFRQCLPMKIDFLWNSVGSSFRIKCNKFL